MEKLLQESSGELMKIFFLLISGIDHGGTSGGMPAGTSKRIPDGIMNEITELFPEESPDELFK